MGEEGHYFFLDLFFFGGVGQAVALFDEVFDLGGDLFLFGFGFSFLGDVVFAFHRLTKTIASAVRRVSANGRRVGLVDLYDGENIPGRIFEPGEVRPVAFVSAEDALIVGRDVPAVRFKFDAERGQLLDRFVDIIYSKV